MLKWVVALLLLANLAYLGWSQTGLAVPQREPERLLAQIKPEAVRLLDAPHPAPAPEAATPPQPPASVTADASPQAAPNPAAETPASPTPSAPAHSASAQTEARSCWLADGLTPRQANRLRSALAGLNLPSGSWQLDEMRGSGFWVVYMGRYLNEAQLERKKAELRALNVPFSDVAVPGLSPGLTLGIHSTEAAAQETVQALNRLGVRTARVVPDRPGATSFSLRLPNASSAQRDAVAAVGEALAGKPLRACPDAGR